MNYKKYITEGFRDGQNVDMSDAKNVLVKKIAVVTSEEVNFGVITYNEHKKILAAIQKILKVK
jgi:hypothetical protein